MDKFNELGCKLTDKSNHIITPSYEEWIGVNLLERDDELLRSKYSPKPKDKPMTEHTDYTDHIETVDIFDIRRNNWRPINRDKGPNIYVSCKRWSVPHNLRGYGNYLYLHKNGTIHIGTAEHNVYNGYFATIEEAKAAIELFKELNQ